MDNKLADELDAQADFEEAESRFGAGSSTRELMRRAAAAFRICGGVQDTNAPDNTTPGKVDAIASLLHGAGVSADCLAELLPAIVAVIDGVETCRHCGARKDGGCYSPGDCINPSFHLGVPERVTDADPQHNGGSNAA